MATNDPWPGPEYEVMPLTRARAAAMTSSEGHGLALLSTDPTSAEAVSDMATVAQARAVEDVKPAWTDRAWGVLYAFAVAAATVWAIDGAEWGDAFTPQVVAVAILAALGAGEGNARLSARAARGAAQEAAAQTTIDVAAKVRATASKPSTVGEAFLAGQEQARAQEAPESHPF